MLVNTCIGEACVLVAFELEDGIVHFLEEEEYKQPTINHNLLLEEIKQIRNKYNINIRYDEKVMENYRNISNNTR